MWIAPEARGLGLARRLLAELEEQVRKAGASVARLETNRALTEAIALYRRSAYKEVGVQRRALRSPLVREADLRIALSASSFARNFAMRAINFAGTGSKSGNRSVLLITS